MFGLFQMSFFYYFLLIKLSNKSIGIGRYSLKFLGADTDTDTLKKGRYYRYRYRYYRHISRTVKLLKVFNLFLSINIPNLKDSQTRS